MMSVRCAALPDPFRAVVEPRRAIKRMLPEGKGLPMSYEAVTKDYEAFDFDDGKWQRCVHRRGTGPAVIVIHEIFGSTPAGLPLCKPRQCRPA